MNPAMPSPGPDPPRTLVLGLACAALLLAASCVTAQTSNINRLRAMPPEVRKALSKNLDRFDALPRDEQKSLRDLDAQITEAEPGARQRYHAVLHRYHLWLRTLTDAQRAKLAETPPDQRMELVNAYLAEGRKTGGLNTTWTHLSGLVAWRPTLVDEAWLIKVWFNLSAEQRKEFGQSGSALEKTVRLADFGRQHGIAYDFSESLAQKEHDALKSANSRRELQKLAQNPLVEKLIERPRRVPLPDQALAKSDMPIRRVIEAVLVQSLHPDPVAARRLNRFAAAMPPWLLTTLDPLPPDAAKERLTLLYRLIYPSGQEMPEPAPAPKSAAPEPAPNRPAAPKAAPARSDETPF